MSNEQATQLIGSGKEQRAPEKPNYLVVEYNGRKMAIGRNPNYQETIASIKKNAHELNTMPDNQIIIFGFLAEMDGHVQITEEVWKNLLPRFLAIRVELGNAPPKPSTLPTENKVGNQSLFGDDVVFLAEDEEDVRIEGASIPATTPRSRALSRPWWRRREAVTATLGRDEEIEQRDQQQTTPTGSPALYNPVATSRGTSTTARALGGSSYVPTPRYDPFLISRRQRTLARIESRASRGSDRGGDKGRSLKSSSLGESWPL